MADIAKFWRRYKRAIVLVVGMTAAAPYLPVLVPVFDAIVEAEQQTEEPI